MVHKLYFSNPWSKVICLCDSQKRKTNCEDPRARPPFTEKMHFSPSADEGLTWGQVDSLRFEGVFHPLQIHICAPWRAESRYNPLLREQLFSCLFASTLPWIPVPPDAPSQLLLPILLCPHVHPMLNCLADGTCFTSLAPTF